MPGGSRGTAGAAGGTAGGARAFAAALLRGPAAAFFASPEGARCAFACDGEVAHMRGTALAPAHPPLPAAASAPPLAPLAVLCTADATLAASHGVPAGTRLRCAFHGQWIALQHGAAGEAFAITLPAVHCEGVAEFELVAADAAAPFTAPPPPRCVLLTADAGIAAEVAAVRSHARCGGAAEADVAQLLWALGHALRAGCALPLLAVATADAVTLGWRATAARLLPALRAACDRSAGTGGC